MSDKKKHKHEVEEVNETPVEAVAMPENGEQLAAEVEALTRLVPNASVTNRTGI